MHTGIREFGKESRVIDSSESLSPSSNCAVGFGVACSHMRKRYLREARTIPFSLLPRMIVTMFVSSHNHVTRGFRFVSRWSRKRYRGPPETVFCEANTKVTALTTSAPWQIILCSAIVNSGLTRAELPIDDGAESPYQNAVHIGLQLSRIQRDRQARILQSPWVKGEQMTTESRGTGRSANRDGRTGAPTELASRADSRRDARRGAASG
ncbi:uncharacterized protein CLUP02_16353 [Colletotrichum lupini]|uniref:Uncharacterized protein n=1 Tax=Colletotrichum lupini TaxID=145971 RepID=A0A9Q8T9Y5_9PEZI|nr:uncharacterized protein CLUP02_16353 [Colletotrichum lupini]UQC90821.1 hypothetical protein CLUP02_16353 [Colletotrichum lupini]